ncbi:MAG: tetratricopeptide repeat protein, partial [Bacteroidales bacterium]|nr:tetratricopeptide repeat protein [Bacteroidales bacterium]
MINVIKNVSICLICWLTLLTTGLAQNKPDADALFLKARDAAFSEHWSEARKICRELLSYYPDYYDASILMGRTYAWELKTDSARTVISPLLDVEPDNYDVLTLLADNEIWGGQYDKALDFINRALEFYPSDEDFLYKKANTNYLKKDHTEAIRVLHELLTVNPDHANGNELLNTILPPQMFLDEIYARADGEAHAGNWNLARQYCRQVLAENPDHFEASLLMAQTFAFENKFDSARIVSAGLHDANPRDYDVLDLMVNIEMWNRKYKAAATRVEEALAAYPNDENFLFKKARIQYLAKDYTDALKTLDELLKINPNHEEALALKNDILENHRYRDYVFVEDYFEFFKEPYLSRKLVTSTGISKWTRHGTYIAKVNMGEELPYKSLAFQYELEAYQQLFPTNYLYLDYAYS